MDIIENIKDTITKTGKSAVKKTKDLAGIAKLTAEIEETESLLEDAYADIGKKYCSIHDKDIADEHFSVNIATVNTLQEHIKELKIQRLNLRGKVICEGCSNSVSDEFSYCPHCGQKLPEKLQDDNEDFFEEKDTEIEIVDNATTIADLDEEIDDGL